MAVPRHGRPSKILHRKFKKGPKIEEIKYDAAAREEYLTGFHKRKAQRIKLGQEIAEKKAREERIRSRKALRDERKAELERHVEAVNAALHDQLPQYSDSDEGEGSNASSTAASGPEAEDEAKVHGPSFIINHEDEYIDEEKYTTVTVEDVFVARDGLHKIGDQTNEVSKPEESAKATGSSTKEISAKKRPPKKRKHQFRYETKAERKITREKQKKGSRAQAKLRKG